MTIDVFDTPDALAMAAADAFAAATATAPRFSVALAGGSTPKRMYALLADAPVNWSRVHVYWGDERCVPPTDSASNYRMTREALLDHVPIPSDNVHRMRGEIDPATAAAEYEQRLRSTLDVRFDLVLLGLGSDGHTASLFPHAATLQESDRWVVADYAAVVSMWRITLTPVAINTAARVWFLVAGEEKADVLRRIVHGPRLPHELPAQLIAPPAGELRWLVDAAAASRLERT